MSARATILSAGAIVALGFGAWSYANPGSDRGMRGPDRGPHQGPHEGPHQGHPQGPLAPEEIFQEIDANGDGSVSQDEFIQHHEQRFAHGRPPGPPHEGASERGPRHADRGSVGHRPPGPPRQYASYGPPHHEGSFAQRGPRGERGPEGCRCGGQSREGGYSSYDQGRPGPPPPPPHHGSRREGPEAEGRQAEGRRPGPPPHGEHRAPGDRPTRGARPEMEASAETSEVQVEEPTLAE